MSNTTFKRYGAPAATALVMALVLAACGGGGGNPGAVGGTGSGSTGNGGTGTGTGGTTVTASPTVTLSFANASGASTNALTGATPLTVKATVLDASKKPVPNAIVTFATDNALAVFSPTAGTALTDVNGVASVTMRAASIASGGAGTVTATSNVAGTTITGTSNYSVGATALSFSTLSAASTSIQAYESTELSVNVLSGSSLYTEQPINVTFKSVCADKGSATLATTVATNNGIAKTVYRDKGCGTNDLITVSADGIAKPATVTLAIAPPRAASVQFASATPVNQSLVIQGKGGIGRTETAVLTFKVVDIFGNPLPGQKVEFRRYPANADVTVNKTTDTTDASGNVVTTVNSGATATTFKVQALLPNTAANGNPDISTMSDSIVVTTGQPVQRAFSIATDKFTSKAECPELAEQPGGDDLGQPGRRFPEPGAGRYAGGIPDQHGPDRYVGQGRLQHRQRHLLGAAARPGTVGRDAGSAGHALQRHHARQYPSGPGDGLRQHHRRHQLPVRPHRGLLQWRYGR